MLTAYIVIAVLVFVGLLIGVPVLDKLDGHENVDWEQNFIFSAFASLIWPGALIILGVMGMHKLLSRATNDRWIGDIVVDKIVAEIKDYKKKYQRYE